MPTEPRHAPRCASILSMLVEPAARSRPKGDFVDANISGGKVLTYEEMEAAVKSKAAVAEAKKHAKREAAEARAARKEETATSAKAITTSSSTATGP
ncbi:hypothetical protein PHYPSEUDO_011950 [Phytophthora pseudosyringae]|uniref:Uncharacterized protein n=1 Tax=Phytophthora pseudosyringae TaxID=221518 RepID=A0A8T1VAG5_9STRA|nr:hypothetical protein PHYPSEUDO_011950 [Phytophthora pseudosyringae]